MIEKVIRIRKCKTEFAVGWGVLNDGSLLIEIPQSDFQAFEERYKEEGSDKVLAEVIREALLEEYQREVTA